MTRAVHRFVALTLLIPFGVASVPAAQDIQEPLPRFPIDPLRLVSEEVFTATIRNVEDGDSVLIKELQRSRALRIDGVDAPELSQDFGPEAKAFLAELVLGKVVTVRLLSRAPAGEESVAKLEIGNADVSAALIRSGMAWFCGQFTENRNLKNAEADAREARRGLWRASRPSPPWHHRGVVNCWN